MKIAKLLTVISIFMLAPILIPLFLYQSQGIDQLTGGIQPTALSSSWKMIFDDEFDGNSLDLSKWTPNWLGSSSKAVTEPVNSYETDCIVPGASKVANGKLDITAVAKPCIVNGRTYPYQSGLIESNGKFNFTYGYMEARIWQPSGSGMWPAFWSDGQNWPQDGEIDVVEGDGTGNSSYHYHYGGWSTVAGLTLWIKPFLLLYIFLCIVMLAWLFLRFLHRRITRMITIGITLCLMLPLLAVFVYNVTSCGGSCGPGGSIVVSGATRGWHTYAADWEPGMITWYYDGQQVWQWTTNVTSSPMYLIINLGSRSKRSISTVTMKVDYVRVWRKRNVGVATARSAIYAPYKITTRAIDNYFFIRKVWLIFSLYIILLRKISEMIMLPVLYHNIQPLVAQHFPAEKISCIRYTYVSSMSACAFYTFFCQPPVKYTS